MKVLYIGQYSQGSTSSMRGEYLKEITKANNFIVIDTSIPIMATNKLFRSFGWRYKAGPLISNINNYIKNETGRSKNFDLIWIDKGLFIKPTIINRLKKNTKLLIHYTPDTAFTSNKSPYFNEAVPLYDFCITTKTFEKDFYRDAGAREVLVCTQGFDPKYHKAYNSFSQKKDVVFVGFNEEFREEAVASLIENGIPVKLGGAKWEKFIKKYSNRNTLRFYGSGLFGEDYSKLISGSLIGLGLVSKKFPEKHTTRTFEIPACGTALAAERNDEICKFFSEDEVLFFSDIKELTEKIHYHINHLDFLMQITDKAAYKVRTNGYDYPTILKGILEQVKILK